MFLTKVKIVLACMLLLGAVATGAGVLARQGEGPADPAQFQIAAPKDKPNKAPAEKPSKQPVSEGELPPRGGLSEGRVKALISELRPGDRMSELIKEQYEAARQEVGIRRQHWVSGTATFDSLLGASRRMLQAELDLSRKPKDHTAALEAYVKRMKEFEAVNQARSDIGQATIADVAQARFDRIRAEIWLERFKTTGKLPADAPALPP